MGKIQSQLKSTPIKILMILAGIALASVGLKANMTKGKEKDRKAMVKKMELKNGYYCTRKSEMEQEMAKKA